MADWKSYEITVPGKDLLEPARDVLETLLVYLDVLKAILDTVKVFMVDFGNPIRVLVESLIKLIEELVLSLKATGVSGYFDIPDPTTDPNFNRVAGGFPAFTERFKASLFDPLDYNRPQPRPGSSQSGFVILVVDAQNVYSLINRVKQLLRFFGREFTSPRYEPPGDLKAIPVGSSGDPILAVSSLFSSGPINAIQLRWALPTSLVTPDPGFSDLVTMVAKEFIPPQFLIERTTVNPASQKIDITALQDPESSGQVEFDFESFTSVQNPTQPVIVRQVLRDEYGDPVVKFQKYVLLDQASFTSNLGQLGTFRYLDTDVEPGKVYYYRVRALSGDLNMIDDSIVFPNKDGLTRTPESSLPVMAWPSTSSDDGVVMGKASGIVSTAIPALTTGTVNFDMLETLKRLFQTAFSLDFHQFLPEGATFDPQGLPTSGSSATDVGKGSLVAFAGALGTVSMAKGVGASFTADPITGSLPELPWQRSDVRKRSAQLATAMASAFVQAGGEALQGFRDLMQLSLPAGTVATGGSLVGADTLEKLVYRFTTVSEDERAMNAAAKTFSEGYSDAYLRLNVLTAVQFTKNYALGGAPVDWVSVSPLRDIVPWSGQMIFDLLDKIQALLDGYKGTLDELKAFIDLMERKIQALERFLEFLVSILDFIEGLQMGAYVLSVNGLTGGPQSWVDAIDNAGGAKPPSGPGGYSAGVAFGYAVPDAVGIATALSVIFGS